MEKANQVYRYPKATGLLLGAGVVAYCSTVLLLISFASPYWLESYQEANSEFVRLGLWDVCFKNYRHPSYQYDETFNGCHWIHSYTYQNIRDWLLPGEFSPRLMPNSTLLYRDGISIHIKVNNPSSIMLLYSVRKPIPVKDLISCTLISVEGLEYSTHL